MASSTTFHSAQGHAQVCGSTSTQPPPMDLGAFKDVFLNNFDEETELDGTAEFKPTKYPHYLPTWDAGQTYPPLEPYDYVERGQGANPGLTDLLPDDARVTDLTPSTGSEVRGVQLSQIGDLGKSQLARLVAQRKVVVFRNQDFADLPISVASDFARYFVRLHVHPTSGCPRGHPEVHLVHRGAGDKNAQKILQSMTSSVAWHSDVTYEMQPPGITFLIALEKPETGGDTLFANCVEAYERLSPAFRQRLHGLMATHSGMEQAKASEIRGSVVRRDPIITEHPVVRTHSITGENSLFINAQFTRHISGLKKDESDAVLKFLYRHIALGADFHARVKWEEGTVVVWDNRVVQHTALVDWKDKQRRHLARLAVQAEIPYGPM